MAKNIDDMISLDPAECYELTGVEVDSNIYDRLIRNDPNDVTKLVGGVARKLDRQSRRQDHDVQVAARPHFHGRQARHGRGCGVLAFPRHQAQPLSGLPDLAARLDEGQRRRHGQGDGPRHPADHHRPGPTRPPWSWPLLSSIVGSVVEKSVALEHDKGGDLGNGWLKTHAAGTGAFALRAWKANESVVLEANPTYREGAPPLKRVVIRHVPEPAAQRLLIEKGDADIARDLTPDQVASIAGDKDVKITASPQATLHYVGNQREGAAARQPEGARGAAPSGRLRRAMANSFLKGQDQVHQTFWPSGFWAALDKNPFTFDPAKAQDAPERSRLPRRFFSIHARCFQLGALQFDGAIHPGQHGPGRRQGDDHSGRAEVGHHQIQGPANTSSC